MKETIKQHEIPKGDKVVMRDNDRGFSNIYFLGMYGAYSKWLINDATLVGNFYGLFHYNTSQKYWYYEPEENKDG